MITMHVIVHLTLVIQYCVRTMYVCDELLPGHVIVMSGPVSYQIKLNDGRIMKCHQDQIRHRHCAVEPPNKLPEVTIPPTIPMYIPKITQNSTVTTPMATEATLESTVCMYRWHVLRM